MNFTFHADYPPKLPNHLQAENDALQVEISNDRLDEIVAFQQRFIATDLTALSPEERDALNHEAVINSKTFMLAKTTYDQMGYWHTFDDVHEAYSKKYVELGKLMQEDTRRSLLQDELEIKLMKERGASGGQLKHAVADLDEELKSAVATDEDFHNWI